MIIIIDVNVFLSALIKDSTTRKHVTDSLERMIQHLRLYTKTPEHGLAAFAGNTSDKEGQQDIEVFSLEPPEPLNFRLYRCDKIFVLDYGQIIADGTPNQIQKNKRVLEAYLGD